MVLPQLSAAAALHHAAQHLVWCAAPQVVGMHPDQATEAILQFALECRKPFAIVPCCVFPR
jgi:hypothetical protein